MEINRVLEKFGARSDDFKYACLFLREINNFYSYDQKKDIQLFYK